MINYRYTAVHADGTETIRRNYPTDAEAIYEAVSLLMTNPEFDLVLLHDQYSTHIGTVIKA